MNDTSGGIEATRLQRAMLLASVAGEGPPPYHLQLVLAFSPGVDRRALREAWLRLLDRHRGLSSRFRFEGTRLFVAPGADDERAWVEREAVVDGADEVARGELERRLREEYERPFDVEGEGPLWRVLVAPMADGGATWSFTCHHAIIDWLSYKVVLYDLGAAYAEELGGAASPDQRAESRGPDFFDQLEWLRRQDWAAENEAWRARFAGLDGPSDFAEILETPGTSATDAGAARRLSVAIAPGLEAGLRALAADEGLSLNTLLIAAWSLWLCRSGDQGQALFGIMRGGRAGAAPGAEEIVGPMLAALPIRVDVPAGVGVRAWLRRVREAWESLRSTTPCPLDLIHEWSGFAPGTPLFVSAVNFQRESFEALFGATRLAQFARFVRFEQTTDLPLVVVGTEAPALHVELVYRPELVEDVYARAAAGGLAALLDRLVRDVDGPLDAIDALGDGERAQVLAFARGPVMALDTRHDARRLFVEVARRQPDAIALERGAERWSYGALLAASGGVAAALMEAGIGREDVVAVSMGASPDLVAAMLGIMRAGAAFFLLHPAMPPARRDGLLRAARASHLIVGMETTGDPAPSGCEILVYHDLRDGAPANPPTGHASWRPTDLAYLVHTSGTTGEAKCVEIEHRALGNVIAAFHALYGMTPADRRLQRAQPGTDFFLAEVLVNMTAGSTLVFLEEEGPLGVSELLEALARQAITVTGMPSSYWHEWASTLAPGSSPRLPPALRLVICGMEKVAPELLRRWSETIGDRLDWINVYGPTETTQVSAAYRPAAGETTPGAHVPIGRPIANTRLYVLDRDLRLLPFGAVGEICIGGAGLMRGYRGAGAGEGGALISDPHADAPEYGWLYRTGDVGALLRDGRFVFLGRRDHQVKIAGHRIELESVETALTQAAGGRASVAVVLSDGHRKMLIGLIEGAHAAEESAVTAALRAGHSPATLPRRVYGCERLPRLPNGKIDREAARRYAEERMATAEVDTDAGANGDAQGAAVFLAAFRRVLGRGELGADDDFFAAGGDSLAAMRAVAEIEFTSGSRPGLRDLYEARTAGALWERCLEGGARGGVVWRLLHGVDDSTEGDHLFVVPTVLGTFSKAELIRRHWRNSLKLWALEQEPHAYEPADVTIESLARGYAEALRAHFAGADISLFGYSSGGLIAWEIARQLAEAGLKVRRLILLEPTTWAPSSAGEPIEFSSRTVPRSAARRLWMHWKWSGLLGARERLRYVRDLLARGWRRRLSAVGGGEKPKSLVPRLDDFQYRVCRAYRPGPYPGRVELVRGLDLIEGSDIETYDRFWRERSGRMHSHTVPGDHYRLFDHLEVRITMHVINKILAGEEPAIEIANAKTKRG